VRRAAWVVFCCVAAVAGAQETPPPPEEVARDVQRAEQREELKVPLLDRTQRGVYDGVWRSAMRIDRLFGSDLDETPYRRVAGSLAPALLWNEFDGFKPRLRFYVDLPLPQLNDRFQAFVGRVNPDEYITERAEPSGAFRRQYGPAEDEETLLGISYRTPRRQGGRFDVGGGVRLRFPLDPYVKGSYVYELGKSETGLLSLRQTLFWRNTEKAGVTSRADVERILGISWLLRATVSGTFSERSDGLKGYTSVMAIHGMPHRRALAFAAGFDGSTDAPVPMHEFGVKAAYRRSISRDWLIMELRTSLTWPKEELEQPRAPSWGVGIGFEMFFGTDDFLARPVTF
jgi:hypothetical protein